VLLTFIIAVRICKVPSGVEIIALLIGLLGASILTVPEYVRRYTGVAFLQRKWQERNLMDNEDEN